jgi:hypothetical protein
VLDGVTGVLAWGQWSGRSRRQGPSTREGVGERGRKGDQRAHDGPHEPRGRLVSITEAVVLAVVTLLAAWSGYAAVVDRVALSGWPGLERPQLILTLLDHPVARLGYLVPSAREVTKRL